MTSPRSAPDSTPGSRPAPTIAMYAFLVLGLLIPMLLTTVVGRRTDSTAEVLLIATTVIAGARYAWIIGSRSRRLYEMVLWLFVYFFLGIAPFLQLRLRWPSTTPSIETAMLAPAAAISLVGVLSLIIGSYCAGRVRTAAHAGHDDASVNERRTYLLTFITLAVAFYYIASVGPSALVTARSELFGAQRSSFSDDSVAAIIRAVATMGLLVAFVSLMHLRQQLLGSGRRRPLLLPILAAATLFFIVNPFNSPRFTSMTVILAVLATLGMYSTLRRFRTVAVSAVLALVTVFPALDTFRHSLDASVELQNPLESLTTGDFDAFAQLANTVQYVETQGPALGRQILGPLLFWVPRSLWPDKPIGTGVVLGEFRGYRFTNLSASVWTEAFINFGWIGVIVMLIALGYLLRRLDMRNESHLQRSQLPTVLGCVLPFYLFILLRGSLLQATAQLVVILLGAWFVTFQMKSRPPAYSQREGRQAYSPVS